jgi:hypothetical protein
MPLLEELEEEEGSGSGSGSDEEVRFAAPNNFVQ